MEEQALFSTGSCIHSSPANHKEGRKAKRRTFHVAIGYFEHRVPASTSYRANGRRAGAAWWQYRRDRPLSAVQVVMTLCHGPKPPGNVDLSHRCWKFPQRCVNPRHLCWELHLYNMSRISCVNGSYGTCPHLPKCIYVDNDGKSLACRNRPGPVAPCTCDRPLPCWGYQSSLLNHAERNVLH